MCLLRANIRNVCDPILFCKSIVEHWVKARDTFNINTLKARPLIPPYSFLVISSLQPIFVTFIVSFLFPFLFFSAVCVFVLLTLDNGWQHFGSLGAFLLQLICRPTTTKQIRETTKFNYKKTSEMRASIILFAQWEKNRMKLK